MNMKAYEYKMAMAILSFHGLLCGRVSSFQTTARTALSHRRSIISSTFVRAPAPASPAAASSVRWDQSQSHHKHHGDRSLRMYASSATKLNLSKQDEEYLTMAIECAKKGVGHTYPNPAVGCVVVRQDTNEVIGSGFHPKAGSPHAEIFALLEASQHIDSGVAAATAVVQGNPSEEIADIAAKYTSEEDGPAQLFGDVFADQDVTAYVTLEPCCHHGQTPPCAETMALAKVNRVVVGFRDPNPKVNGGGVTLLRTAGVEVEMATGSTRWECGQVAASFLKRITPRAGDDEDEYASMTGSKRRALRAYAGKRKADGSLVLVNWGGERAETPEATDELEIDAGWMEQLDNLLWEHEVVNMRLNKAVGKKKLAKQLGTRIADELKAHVTQAVGHTVLLYRPGSPPTLDLESLSTADAKVDAEAKPSE